MTVIEWGCLAMFAVSLAAFLLCFRRMDARQSACVEPRLVLRMARGEALEPRAGQAASAPQGREERREGSWRARLMPGASCMQGERQ